MSESVRRCETCGGLSGVRPSTIAGETHYFNSVSCKDEWVTKRIKDLEERVKEQGAELEQHHRVPCVWSLIEVDGYYITLCGKKWVFTDGTLEDKGVKYCPYCGGEIVEAGDE